MHVFVRMGDQGQMVGKVEVFYCREHLLVLDWSSVVFGLKNIAHILV